MLLNHVFKCNLIQINVINHRIKNLSTYQIKQFIVHRDLMPITAIARIKCFRFLKIIKKDLYIDFKCKVNCIK